MSNYIGPDDRPCHRNEWLRLKQSGEFAEMELYENTDFKVYIRWNGQANESFPMTWPIFTVIGETFVDGKWVVNFEKNAPDLKRAKQFRKELLTQWTESFESDKGELVEVGNVHVPPPPPDPNRPESSAVVLSSDDDGEVW